MSLPPTIFIVVLLCTCFTETSCENNKIGNKNNVVSKEQFLDQANNDLNNFKSNLSYKVYYTQTDSINHELKIQILSFINEHYIANSRNKLIYSEALFDYFINNALIIVAFKDNMIIGVICGKLQNLIYKNDNPIAIPEIDFLCLHKKLRNIYLAPFLISAITKEVIESFDISCAYYTIANPINAKSFTTKKMYHRCININNLI